MFTQGNAVFSLKNTKRQQNLFEAILNGNSDAAKLAKQLGITKDHL